MRKFALICGSQRLQQKHSNIWWKDPLVFQNSTDARSGWVYHLSPSVCILCFLCLFKARGCISTICIGNKDQKGLFSWHPVFMSIAFCLCLTEAVLVLSPESSFFCCSNRTKVQLHWTTEMLVLLAATLGLVFIISSKNRSELPHFVSWHSLLGLLTLVATCGQVLCGLCLHFPHLLKISSKASLQLYHRTCGLIVYLLATFTVILAIYSDWFQAQIKGLVWYFYLALSICPALVVMNQISRTCLPKKTQYV